ncbi:Uncharacterised protein [uncultured archaeon]|nr:Uncharacterised protein [uncultured archaeon]
MVYQMPRVRDSTEGGRPIEQRVESLVDRLVTGGFLAIGETQVTRKGDTTLVAVTFDTAHQNRLPISDAVELVRIIQSGRDRIHRYDDSDSDASRAFYEGKEPYVVLAPGGGVRTLLYQAKNPPSWWVDGRNMPQ